MLPEDRELLDAYRRGDRGALARVYQAFVPMVSRWISGGFSFPTREGTGQFAGFRSAVDQHDAIHEVFRSVFEERARAAYSGLSPFESYLFVVTRNVVIKRLRRLHRDRPVEVEVLEGVPSPDPSPEEQIGREQEVTIVRSFLSTLAEEDRAFIELRFTEQLPQATVGERLGWSRKKVRLKEASLRESLARFLRRRRTAHELKEEAHDGAR